MQRGVEDHDARIEGQTPRKVQDGPRDVGDLEPVDRRDLVVAKSGDVAPEHARRLGGRGRTPGDVHAVEPGPPQRESQEDRRRLVTHDRRSTQITDGGRDEQRVPGDRRRGQLPVHVRAASNAVPLLAPDQPCQLLVGAPVGYRLPAKDEPV